MPAPNKFSALVDYFSTLADKHTQIRDFYRFELDEVLAGLRDIQTPCLILEGYKFSLVDNKSDNILKNRSGAFILLSNVEDIGSSSHVHAAWDYLEEIGDDVLARIKSDKRNPDFPVRDFNFESVEGSLLYTEFGNYVGIRFTFDISSKFTQDVNPLKWKP